MPALGAAGVLRGGQRHGVHSLVGDGPAGGAGAGGVPAGHEVRR